MGLALLCEALCEIIAAAPERYKRPRLLPRIAMTQQIISGTRARRTGNRSADFYFWGWGGLRGGRETNCCTSETQTTRRKTVCSLRYLVRPGCYSAPILSTASVTPSSPGRLIYPLIHRCVSIRSVGMLCIFVLWLMFLSSGCSANKNKALNQLPL